MSNKEIISEALNLPLADRLFIVNKLIESFNPMDESIQKKWLKEIDDRQALFEKGELETLSYSEFFDED